LRPGCSSIGAESRSSCSTRGDVRCKRCR
jgi:hypothetical protein